MRRCCTATCTKQSYQRRDAEEKGKQKSQRTGQTQEEEAAVLGADVHVSKAVRLCKNGPDREHICSGTCQESIRMAAHAHRVAYRQSPNACSAFSQTSRSRLADRGGREAR
ncbi:TPA: hypothetical protein ACH3X3_000271 [Trebouxia sp. C0006]